MTRHRALTHTLAAFLAAGGIMWASPAGAQPARPNPMLNPGVEQSDPNRLPPLESVLKDLTPINNNLDKDEATFFALYRDEDRLLAVIPQRLLGRLWLLSSTMAAGPFMAGEQLGAEGVEWRRRNNELLLYKPELRYTSDREPALAPGVRRVFTDRYLFSAPILAEGGTGMLIDLTALITGQSGQLLGVLGAIDARAARVENAKAFAENVEVGLSAPSQFAWIRGQLVTLHFSFSALPNDPLAFERRPADQRVGYWVHARRDVGARDPLESNFNLAIERWRLRKADPKAEISPPEKPIVFYIEKTVPPAYRLHVRRGVEAWNEAFREIGIENAIEVRQQTETQHANIDPEDVRYNFIRWVPTGAGYAIALHRTDPRTGEILDADVVIDDAWINAWVNEDPLFLASAMQPRLRALERENKGWVADRISRRVAGGDFAAQWPDGGTHELTAERFAAMHPAARRAALDSHLRTADLGVLGEASRHRRACAYSQQLGTQVALARIQIATANNGIVPEADLERLIGDNLVALTAHEVGHVLGLRHNFAGSAWKPASAIDDYTDPAQEPPATSVMDYIGTFIPVEGRRKGPYNTVRIGAYDRWAIAYGYMTGNKDELNAHLAKSSDPRHRYMTDEDVYGLDPTAMRYDFGSDPVEGRQRELAIIDRARDGLVKNLIKPDQNYRKVGESFRRLFIMEMMALWNTTGWVGGSYRSRDHNTEGANRPLEPVEPERQRAVLDMLIERVLSESSFQFDRELLATFQPEKWYLPTFGSWGDAAEEFDVHGMTNLAQFFILSDLMFVNGPRLLNQELRVDPDSDALTAPELYARLTGAIWSEFENRPARDARRHTNLRPKVNAVRRNLQREHVEQLVDMGYRVPPSVATPAYRQLQTLAVHELRQIRDRIGPWLEGNAAANLDDYTRIHTAELARLIDATLEASVQRTP
ncbi:MAG: DUF5117 domain-containing protein [Phycisphaerales bacterium]|nr:MAG: DUF5117 domain-containing protein [Phycisphaerales bacterium]